MPEAWKKAEKEFEDTISSKYEDLYYGHAIERIYLKHFAAFVRKYAKKTDAILDLGCGTGILEAELDPKKFSNITGVDLSEKMINLASEKVKGAAFLAADGEHLPFKDNSFDIIICSSTLHHFPDLSPILQELKRVLKEHGLIIIREPNRDHHFTRPSWLSGAVLSLMRYIYRIERYQAEAEPPMHQYHRSFEIKDLYSTLANHFSLHYYSTFFPLSCLFTKVRSAWVIRFIFLLEKTLKKQAGNQIYAVAANYESHLGGVSTLLRNHLDQLETEKKEPKMFLLGFYFLLWFVKCYEKIKK